MGGSGAAAAGRARPPDPAVNHSATNPECPGAWPRQTWPSESNARRHRPSWRDCCPLRPSHRVVPALRRPWRLREAELLRYLATHPRIGVLRIRGDLGQKSGPVTLGESPDQLTRTPASASTARQARSMVDASSRSCTAATPAHSPAISSAVRTASSDTGAGHRQTERCTALHGRIYIAYQLLDHGDTLDPAQDPQVRLSTAARAADAPLKIGWRGDELPTNRPLAGRRVIPAAARRWRRRCAGSGRQGQAGARR
jgi:hypothetical protein